MIGTVSLYHHGSIVQSNQFNTEKHREKLIDQWKRLYGKGFSKTVVKTVYSKPKVVEKKKAFPKSSFKKGDLPKIYKLK